MADNILNLTNNLTQKQKEQVCSELIQQKENNALLTGEKLDTLTLSTKGRKRELYLKKSDEPVTFSSESLHTYQVHSGSSGQQMKKLATFVRANAGRKSIPPHYSKQISAKAKVLEDFYKCEILDFDVDKSKVQQK